MRNPVQLIALRRGLWKAAVEKNVLEEEALKSAPSSKEEGQAPEQRQSGV